MTNWYQIPNSSLTRHPEPSTMDQINWGDGTTNTGAGGGGGSGAGDASGDGGSGVLMIRYGA